MGQALAGTLPTERPGRPAGLRFCVVSMLIVAPLGWAMFYAVFARFPGQDWVVFHTAAQRFLAGDLSLLLEPHRFTAEINRSHAAWLGAPLEFHPWVDPPPSLLLFLPFGLLPYMVSYCLFLTFSATAMVAALWPWAPAAPSRALLFAGVGLSPFTAFNIGAGQLGFMITALLAGGVWLMPRRPVLAGLLFSLVALKPTFGLMIPFALLAGRHWRAMVSCTAGVIVLCVASVLAFGLDLWRGWFGFVAGFDPRFAGVVEALHRFDQSVFTSLDTLGAPHGMANAAQIGAMLLGASGVWVAFAWPLAWRSRVVVLLCAAMLAGPHVAGYDAVMLALASTLVLIDVHRDEAGSSRLWLATGVWLSAAITPPALIAVLGQPWLTALSACMPLLTAALMIDVLRHAWPPSNRLAHAAAPCYPPADGTPA